MGGKARTSTARREGENKKTASSYRKVDIIPEARTCGQIKCRTASSTDQSYKLNIIDHRIDWSFIQAQDWCDQRLRD